ncbi:uncharacterized protein EDB91DRAFT_1238356 [Suillus paluster]|uniref:uncharacterized protein n=1 Tax=Suillus paluster TaxID=48578 RepID=UPI001B86DC78|nr:uncharacterized protein EDB91DRAFT_1238356 [Suillus paluster]KAG1734675.1 hypothetical protein EDB91DRAFT_1238356 [Suillus paluster]
MTFSTAPALLFGLGIRVALNKFSSTSDASIDESAISDVILLGVVQGVALYYALMEYPDFAFAIAFGIAARLAIEFMMLQDVSRCATTLLGVALGVLVTDVLSQLIEDGYFYDFNGDSSRDHESTYAPKRKRLVKFQSSTEYKVIPPSRPPRSRRNEPEQRWRAPPSLTSTSSIDPNHNMSPLERELAVLRAKASLADSERRRFKEEKKWAESQGNIARVSQMSWQVKRYTALTQSFTREADARLLEVTAMKQRQQLQTTAAVAPQPSNRHQVDRHTNHSRQTAQEVVIDRQSTVTVDVARRHRRQSSGTLKSAMRLQVR